MVYFRKCVNVLFKSRIREEIVITRKIVDYVKEGKIGKEYLELVNTRWVIDSELVHSELEELFGCNMFRCIRSGSKGVETILVPENCTLPYKIVENIAEWNKL